MAKYYLISGDGDSDDDEIKEVSEDKFQETIDNELAEHNGGVVPTNDDEREVIIERIRKWHEENKFP